MHGINMLKSYSWSQDIVCNSSGEDEYYAICFVAKGSGMQAEIAGLGGQLDLVVYTGLTAAEGIGNR